MSFELPASAMTVLLSLCTRGPMTPTEICEKTTLPDRTISFALRKLVKRGLIQRIPNLRDMRSALYHAHLEKAREIISNYGPESIIGSQLLLILQR